MKKDKTEDYEIKFWKDWLNADCLKKINMVEKLPVLKEITQVYKLPKKLQIRSLALLLNSFFEDLESAVYTKIRLEKKR